MGACNTAETPENAPASAHVTALTRHTEIPQSRAESGLLATARICLPNTEYRMNSASAATRTGTRIAVRMFMPVSVTPPMCTLEWNGCG